MSPGLCIAERREDCAYPKCECYASLRSSAASEITFPCEPCKTPIECQELNECVRRGPRESSPSAVALGETPRTDAAAKPWANAYAGEDDEVVPAQFARQLEREVKQWRDQCHDARAQSSASLPGTPEARLEHVHRIAEKYCGHSPVSSRPPELAIEEALAKSATTDDPGDWQCRDYADGWITFPDRAAAEKYQQETGAMMRYRRFYPASAADRGDE